MELKVDIKGLRFRASDGNLSAADKLRILGLRLSNTASIRLRAGDNPAYLPRIVAQRRSVMRKSILADMPMIDDSRLPFKVAKGIVPGSLTDGRKIAAAENEGGRKLRVPTEPELLQLNKLLGNQLEGSDDWIWTETGHENHPGTFILRLQGGGIRDYGPADSCNGAVRFVEDR